MCIRRDEAQIRKVRVFGENWEIKTITRGKYVIYIIYIGAESTSLIGDHLRGAVGEKGRCNEIV